MVFDGLDQTYTKNGGSVCWKTWCYNKWKRNRSIDHSSRERYLRVLGRSPALFQEIPHRYIANYLRMSAETLSRLKVLT